MKSIVGKGYKRCPQCKFRIWSGCKQCSSCGFKFHNAVFDEISQKFGSVVALCSHLNIPIYQLYTWLRIKSPPNLSLEFEIRFYEVTGYTIQDAFPEYEPIVINEKIHWIQERQYELSPDIQWEEEELNVLRRMALEIALKSVKDKRGKDIVHGLLFRNETHETLGKKHKVTKARAHQIYWDTIDEISHHHAIHCMRSIERGIPGYLICPKVSYTPGLDYFKRLFSYKGIRRKG